jgi:hypothetical protein
VRHPDKRSRRTSRRGGTSPRSIDWATIELALCQLIEDSLSASKRVKDAPPLKLTSDRDERAKGAPPLELTSDEVLIISRTTLTQADPNNKMWAALNFSGYANILGPQDSIDILRERFGVAILKQSLTKKRDPAAARRRDNRLIRTYVEIIMEITGESMRDACGRLAKMGLRVRKDAAAERVWVALDEEETIRKRCMSVARDDGVLMNAADLLLRWHREGEPPFLNWLKRLIAQHSSGP